jgi:hypothetical protein
MTRPLASLQPKTKISEQFAGKIASDISNTAFHMFLIQTIRDFLPKKKGSQNKISKLLSSIIHKFNKIAINGQYNEHVHDSSTSQNLSQVHFPFIFIFPSERFRQH